MTQPQSLSAGANPRKQWPFPASVEHRGLCSPSRRDACNPETATCSSAQACRESGKTGVPMLLRADRPAAN